MLSRRTVFVVGAGASRELELPIGEGLKSWIAQAIRIAPNNAVSSFSDRHVEAAVRSYVGEEEPANRRAAYDKFVEAATVITKALPFALSIDQYLDSQRGDPTIVRLGKIGIAASILRAERESTLNKKPNTGRLQDIGRGFPQDAGKTWHLKLVQLLTAGRPKDDMANVFDDVAFVVFNYDRCLEHYFSLALSRYYGEESAVTHLALRSLQILHPYGQVGAMPWQDDITVPFGGQPDGLLRRVADEILTFTESARAGVTEQVKQLVASAETLVFMGFGFLPQNVELLTARNRSNARRVFYTTKGISAGDTEFVNDDLETIVNKPAVTGLFEIDPIDAFERYQETETCWDLMNNNWMRLTR
jgi:hypothetical protein